MPSTASSKVDRGSKTEYGWKKFAPNGYWPLVQTIGGILVIGCVFYFQVKFHLDSPYEHLTIEQWWAVNQLTIKGYPYDIVGKERDERLAERIQRLEIAISALQAECVSRKELENYIKQLIKNEHRIIN